MTILMWHTASVVREKLKERKIKNMNGQDLFDLYQKNGTIYANRPS